MTDDLVGRGWRFPPGVDARGAIGLTSETSELDEAIRIILLTAPGERRMRPDFGCRIHELQFAPLNVSTFGLFKRYVEEAIGRWEPRVDLVDVDVDEDAAESGRVVATITYKTKALRDERSLVFPYYLIGAESAAQRAALTEPGTA